MNQKSRLLLFAALAGTASFAVGCGAARPSKYYALTPPSGSTTSTPGDAAGPSLVLGPMMTSHLYREDRIVYSSDHEQMGTYETERWAEPPVEMMQNILLRKLRSAGHCKDVNTVRSGAHGDYLLRGRLYDFKEVSGRNFVARLSFDLEMHDTKTNATVWTFSYNYDEPVGAKDISSVVAALDRNVQRAAGEVSSALDQYFSTHPMK